MRHPDEAKDWHVNSNYVVCLSVKDENELLDLARKLEAKNIKHVIFREPDLGNQATSISIEPCDAARKVCSSLPLMFKERREAKEAPTGLVSSIKSLFSKQFKFQTNE